MDMKDFRAMGLVTNNPLVKRTITIQYHALIDESQPELGRQKELSTDTTDIWLRKYSAADTMAITFARSDTERAYIAIQRSIFNEDGSPMFTMDEALGLDLVLFAPMLKEIRNLNEAESKKSQPGKSSGANSRSPSAAKASRNGKTTSAKKKRSPGANTGKRTAR